MLNALFLTLIEHWPGGNFLLLRFFITFGKLAPNIRWFFLVRQLLHEKKHGKMQPGMQPNGWQDLMDRVHAGLIKEKDCAEVADGPFGLTMDSPGNSATSVTFFWGMVKKVSLLFESSDLQLGDKLGGKKVSL